MTTISRWSFLSLAALSLTALSADVASAQVFLQRGVGQRRANNSIVLQPSVNSWPGIPAQTLFQPAFQAPWYTNPALNNPWMNQVVVTPVNAWGVNPGIVNTAFSTPPIAVQQGGMMMYRGPNLQVNPWTGTVYQPLSGVVTLADGSSFYRVPGSGLPTAVGNYATGSGLYYNPRGGTFFNPSSGVISRPGTTNVFLPYVIR